MKSGWQKHLSLLHVSAQCTPTELRISQACSQKLHHDYNALSAVTVIKPPPVLWQRRGVGGLLQAHQGVAGGAQLAEMSHQRRHRHLPHRQLRMSCMKLVINLNGVPAPSLQLLWQGTGCEEQLVPGCKRQPWLSGTEHQQHVFCTEPLCHWEAQVAMYAGAPIARRSWRSGGTRGPL
jgi:hypothetical protein